MSAPTHPNAAITMKKSIGAAKTASWRANKAAREQAVIDALNIKRNEMNLPSVTLTLKHEVPFKGKRRPEYNPPPAIMASMSQEQLSAWRADERKKRKASRQRENRLRKEAMINDAKSQLYELEAMSARNKIAESEEEQETTLEILLKETEQFPSKRPVYNPPPAVLARMNKKDLSVWRANQRKKRKVDRQREKRKDQKIRLIEEKSGKDANAGARPEAKNPGVTSTTSSQLQNEPDATRPTLDEIQIFNKFVWAVGQVGAKRLKTSEDSHVVSHDNGTAPISADVEESSKEQYDSKQC